MRKIFRCLILCLSLITIFSIVSFASNASEHIDVVAQYTDPHAEMGDDT